jgi:hypothetical protein
MSGFDIGPLREGTGGQDAAPQSMLLPSGSWLDDLGVSLKGVLAGLVIVPAALVLLYLLEGSTIVAAGALAEGRDAVVEAQADTIDPALEGRLVHVSGPVRPGLVADEALGINQEGLILRRRVEMLQWREDRRRVSVDGGSRTEVSYGKVWSEQPIDSSRFVPYGASRPVNPAMAVRSESFTSGQAALGSRRLAPGLIRDQIDPQPLAVTDEMAVTVGASLGRSARAVAGVVFVGADPNAPAIGDLRISYSLAAPETATAVAKQQGTGLLPYETPNGGQVAILRPGTVAAAAMFASAEAGKSRERWAFRLVGSVLLFAGFLLVMRPAAALVQDVPLIGWVVDSGTKMAAFTLTVLLAPLAIGLAWLRHEPGFSLLLMSATVAAVLGVKALLAFVRGRAGTGAGANAGFRTR